MSTQEKQGLKQKSQIRTSKGPPSSKRSSESKPKASSSSGRTQSTSRLSAGSQRTLDSSAGLENITTQQHEHSLWQESLDSEALATYLDDPTHSNPGYSTAYTNALIYHYGFPEEADARSELQKEIVQEAESCVRRSIDEYDTQMRGDGSSEGESSI